MVIHSFAKINIFLEITGKENELHNLHSLFVKVNLCDEISIAKSDKLEVLYENKKITNDIITKTVNILRNHFPQINANFSFNVTKNIPVGAGLGGASSNAASVVQFLLSENNIAVSKNNLLRIGKAIGADVPFFLCNKPQILIGSSVELSPPLFVIPKLYGVIAFPKCELLTKSVFAKISPPYTPHAPLLSFNDAISRSNDMQHAADIITNGLILETLAKISHKSAVAVKMSGSGCACFSLFEEESLSQECFNTIKDDNIQAFLVEIL